MLPVILIIIFIITAEMFSVALDNGRIFLYNIKVIGVWRSLVSRLVRVQEASGSNPDTPTKEPESAFAGSGSFFVSGFERLNRNSPVELYECGISCYSLVFCGLFPCFSYDMVTAARCPRTRIVPHNRAEVKRAFCSVSWQTDGASLRSAERVEQQSSKQGAAEDSCPLFAANSGKRIRVCRMCFARAVPLHCAGLPA